MLSNKRTLTVGVFALSSALALGACSGAGGGSSDNGSAASGGNVTLNLATVNNGQMKDMEQLKTEYETANPGTKVNFQVMEEGDLRSAVTADVASGAGQYDIVTIGAYETPQWGANGWLVDLTENLKADTAYDVNDLLPPVRVALTNDGKQYAVPFYGESSILMYNKEVLDKAGVTMPMNPTWQQVSDAAKKVKTADMSGICMRGKPGWGDLFAPLTTVVQTFGGNWYDMKWNATVNTPEWKKAVTFYKTMLDESGEADPVSYSFNECLTALKEGKSAMWADASVAASMLEAADSPVKGKMGYAHMPVNKTAGVRLAVELEPRGPEVHEEPGRRDQVRQVGHEQGVHQARRPEDRLEQRAPGLAHLDLRHPGVQGSGRGLRADHPRRDERRQPEAAGRQPAAVGRHPVRLHPGVPGRRQPVRPARSPTTSPTAPRSTTPSPSARTSRPEGAARRTSRLIHAPPVLGPAACGRPQPLPPPISRNDAKERGKRMTTTATKAPAPPGRPGQEEDPAKARLDRPRAVAARIHLPHRPDPDPIPRHHRFLDDELEPALPGRPGVHRDSTTTRPR